MPSPDKEKLKERAIQAVEAQREQLIDLSLRIHQNPEVGFQEEKASQWLCDYLEQQGFQIERAYGGLDTAFKAVAGEGSPRIAFLAEYDALPGLGHACGHNIIAASSIGAAVAVKELLPDAGGSVVVIGTPAEEIHGGKAIMAERGAFDGLDAVMLFHPGSRNAVFTGALACASLYVEYFGKEAHAATRPEAGINALDAVIIAYNAVSALRQHIRDTARIHGIITDGGKAPNVIPGHAAASFLVRAADEGYLEELKEKMISCFRAGAEATGARLEYRWAEVQYAPLHPNRPLAEACRQNLMRLGRKAADSATFRGLGSTDVGNVSLIAPTIHPSIAIAPRGVAIHTPDFARIAASEEGHRGLLDAAKALAMTAIDVQTDEELRDQIRDYFLGQPASSAS